MYPIGHFSIAVAFRRKKGWLFLAFCMFLTILPDFDYILGFTHRTFSHSLVFAVITGYIISRKYWLYFSSMIVSHSVLDMLCQDVPRNGVQFFWPFSYQFFQIPFHPFSAVPIIESLQFEL